MKLDLMECDLEDVIEEMINDVPKNETVNPFYFKAGNVYRQHEIKGYGTADIINININNDPEEICRDNARSIDITVIELKKGTVSTDAVLQISRYMSGIINHFNVTGYDLSRTSISVSGIIVGRDIDKRTDFVYLMDRINDVSVYLCELNYKTGISLTRHYFSGYHNKSIEHGEYADKIVYNYISGIKNRCLKGV